MAGEEMENCLYYGDNLDILKRYIKDETIDLIYLDPPFKSDQSYNVLFQERNGTESAAQVKAFEDTWHWDKESAALFEDVVRGGGKVADAMIAFRNILGSNDMLAYLSMMAPRLVELRRVLKKTGSIYLHCDPTASHYLKPLMDSIFGLINFKNELIWKRTTTKTDIRQGATNWPRIHDVILYYRKDGTIHGDFHQPFIDYSPEYIEKFYRHKDPDGRLYTLDKLTGPGSGTRGHPEYELMGVTRHWVYGKEKMEEMVRQGRIIQTHPGVVPRYKRYLDEVEGVAIGDMWVDLPAIQAHAKERLGFPTQKPEGLLERIISASSDEGDLILDPFCGCGTTIAVAQRLNRRWIGVDVTHLAITLMRHRLKDTFGDKVKFRVIGEPTDMGGAQALSDQDKYQFQWWALGLVGARPVEQKKGADKGIDGRLFFFVEKKAEQIIFSVKGGGVNASHVRDLRGVVERENAAIGVLISLEEPTGPMRTEAADGGFYGSRELGSPKYPRIQILTIEDLLNGKKIDCPHSAYLPQSKRETFAVAPKAKKGSKNKQSKLSEHAE